MFKIILFVLLAAGLYAKGLDLIWRYPADTNGVSFNVYSNNVFFVSTLLPQLEIEDPFITLWSVSAVKDEKESTRTQLNLVRFGKRTLPAGTNVISITPKINGMSNDWNLLHVFTNTEPFEISFGVVPVIQRTYFKVESWTNP